MCVCLYVCMYIYIYIYINEIFHLFNQSQRTMNMQMCNKTYYIKMSEVLQVNILGERGLADSETKS